MLSFHENNHIFKLKGIYFMWQPNIYHLVLKMNQFGEN